MPERPNWTSSSFAVSDLSRRKVNVQMRWSPGLRQTGSKIPPSCWISRLRTQQFDAVAEASEFPDHSRSARLLRLFADSRATFFVTESLVQNLPDQTTRPMGNGSDGLSM